MQTRTGDRSLKRAKGTTGRAAIGASDRSTSRLRFVGQAEPAEQEPGNDRNECCRDGFGKPSYRRARRDRHRQPARRAFSLIELLLVVAFLGIVAGALLPSFQPAVAEQLTSSARAIAADVMYCRDLAVGNSTHYTLTFDTTNNRYWLEHTGTNPLLDNLPAQPFAGAGSTATRHVINLDELPDLAAPVRLVAVESMGSTTHAVTTLELGPMGETTRSVPTRIWIACGSEDGERFIYLEVDPVTGLVREGDVRTQAPATY